MTDWQEIHKNRIRDKISRGRHKFETPVEIKEDPTTKYTGDSIQMINRNILESEDGGKLEFNSTQEWVLPSISEKKFISFNADYGVEYLVNTSSSVVVTLPEAKKNAVIVIKDYLGQAVVNPIQVKARGSETIDGYTSKWINADYWSLTLVSDGSNWFMKNQVDGTMLNQVTLASAATVDIDWSIGDTYKLAVDAGTTAAVTVTHSNLADKVIILAIHNTSSTTGLALTLPSAIGNSSLSSTTMPVTVDAASWSIFTWFNLNAGTAGSGNLFVSGVENIQ
jgi:hypothetical protein